MDRWERIFDLQRLQQESLGLDPTEMAPTLLEETSRHLALGLYEEAAELARSAVRFKAHVLKQQRVEKSEVIGEAADVIKYVLALAQLHDVGADELYQEVLRKTAVVEDRANGERLKLEHDTSVILVDMDGCIADLAPLEALIDAAGDTRVEEAVKAEFRSSGGFRTLPIIDGARDGMAKLKELGYKLVIITSRPYRRYKRLYGDTMEWLRENDIEYDLILFQRDKAEAIAEYIHPAQPLCFIEDRVKHAFDITRIGVPVLLFGESIEPFYIPSPHKELVTKTADWGAVIEHVASQKENGHESKSESNVDDVDAKSSGDGLCRLDGVERRKDSHGSNSHCSVRNRPTDS